MIEDITHHIADADERRIVTKLVGLLLADGMHLRVFDGGGYATGWTTDAATILGNIAHTDEAHLMVGKPSSPDRAVTMIADEIGSFLLIFGNGEDVISDMDATNAESVIRLDAIFDQAIA